MVPHKGVEYEGSDIAVKKVLDDLEFLGYKKVLSRSDNEPAILAFCRRVKGAWNGETIAETSPEGESQSNGAAEKAVQTLKAQVRTIVDDLETKINNKLTADHPVISWIVEYAGAVLRRYVVGLDGQTPFQRVTGRAARGLPAEFGERIWYTVRS